jgi:hypothetical protein
MAKYHCYYLEDGRTHSDIDVEAPDDAAVLLKAEELLRESRFIAMEILDGSRLVGRVTVGSPAALMGNEGSGHTPEPK